MKPIKFLSPVILLAALVAAGSTVSLAGEAYYRWTDKWGNPVHSDRPPPKGIDYEVVASGSSLVRKVNSAEGVVPAKIEPSIDKQAEPVDAGPSTYTREKNPEYCERAKSNLNTLDTVARIRLRNDDGEYHFLSEEDKESQRKEARNHIEAYCE